MKDWTKRLPVVLLIAALLGAGLLPVGAGVRPVAAADCVASNGHFTGDCYFLPSIAPPSGNGNYSCDVNYTKGTYTNGCTSVPFAPINAAHFAPTQEGAHCDGYAGGYYCPEAKPRPGRFIAPGETCDNLTNTGTWNCWPSGAPGDVTDCALPTATGVDVTILCKPTPSFSPTPSASPSPSPLPSGSPCVAQGGTNLICNGDFTDPPRSTQQVEYGVWSMPGSLENDACGSIPAPGYVQLDGRAILSHPDGSCVRPPQGMVRFMYQRFQIVPGGTGRLFHIAMDVGSAGGSVTLFDAAIYLFSADGTQYEGDAHVTKSDCTYSGDLYYEGYYNQDVVQPSVSAGHLECTVPLNDGDPRSSWALRLSENAVVGGAAAVYVDNVVVTLSGSSLPLPSPSPSPSPSPGAGGGSEGQWNCQPTSSPDEVRCTVPPAPSSGTHNPNTPDIPNDPNIHNCVVQADGHSICQGDTPSPDPSASPSPAPSGVPGPANTGVDGGTGTCQAATNAIDLPGHAAYLGCQFNQFEQQVYGIGLAFASGFQFVLDLGRIGVLVGRQVVGLLGNTFALLGWLGSLVAATFSGVGTALSTPAAALGEQSDLFNGVMTAFPPLAMLINGACALLWLYTLVWVVKQVGKLANG